MEQHLYYKSSGKASAISIITSIIIGLICAGILATLYIALQWFIPIIYFNFLITICLALGLIFVADFLHKNGKIRNKSAAISTTFILAVFAVYFQWALFVSLMMGSEGTMGNDTWIKSSFNFDYFSIYFLNPTLLWEDMQLLNSYGTFSLKSSTVSGTFLWVIWAVEALVIIGWPIVAIRDGNATTPFSESENSWMVKRELSGQFPYIEDKDTLINQLKNNDLSAISGPLPAEEIPDQFATATLYELTGDPFQYLTIKNTTLKTNKKGEVEKKEKTVIKYFKLTAGTIA